MSKAFVIKNKEGEYLEESKNMYGDDTTIWHIDISGADIYPTKEFAEMRLEPFYRNCEVVEITIAEGDLEQQLDKAEQELAFYQDEIKNRGTCGLCEKLENKQIKELKEQLVIREKALELACGKKGDTFKRPCICEIGDFNQCYNCKYKHYIEQAKESIK